MLLAARSGVSVVLITNANTRVVFAGGEGTIDERESPRTCLMMRVGLIIRTESLALVRRSSKGWSNYI